MKGARSTTTLGFALLGLIHQEPRSGYDLCKIFETTPLVHYSSSPGAIYPALRRLERDGLLAGQVEKRSSLRPRRVFELTESGVEALAAWVAQPVTHDDIVWRVEELMLRFSFMGQLVDGATTTAFLGQLADGIDVVVEGLERHLSTMRDVEPPHGRLALEHGIESYRGLARWARRASAEIRERVPGRRSK